VRRNKRTLIAAIAVGALVLAGSAAFTDTLTTSAVTQNNVGYGTVNVTGGALDSISYTLGTQNPPQVSAVDLYFAGDTSLQSAYVGFNQVTHGTFGATLTDTCGAPDNTVDAGAETEYICDVHAYGITPGDINDTDISLANT